MVLFLIGILEMVIATAWTRVVTRAKIMASGAVTMVNILLWYYVLRTVIDDINNWRLVLLYALGCSIGTVVSMYFFGWLDRIRLNAGAENTSHEQSESIIG